MTPSSNLLSPDDPTAVRDVLRDYYGKQLKQTEDLTQSACCTDTILVQCWLRYVSLISMSRSSLSSPSPSSSAAASACLPG